MPNMDPRAMRNLMAKMGIKSTELDASEVVIRSAGGEILISNPQVTRIEAQGDVSFQITGDISERKAGAGSAEEPVEVTDEDIDMVAEKTGVADREAVRKALFEENGNIARAILRLGGRS